MNSLWTTINEVFEYYSYFTPIIYFIFCACLGSYFNLFAYRWPIIQEQQWLKDIEDWFNEKQWAFTRPNRNKKELEKLTLSTPRSFCPQCKKPIPFYYNVPVIGWGFLKGKSQCCQQNISFKYPFFEFVCGLTGVFSWVHFHNAENSIIFLLFAMPLFMAAQTDLESMMLPDTVNGFLLTAGLFISLYVPQSHLNSKEAFLGGVLSYFTLQMIRVIGSALFKKEAMGQGDPKLFAAIGSWIGAVNIPQTLLIASLTALVYALCIKIFQYNKVNQLNPAIPFGPFLAIAGLVSYIYPNIFY